MAYPSFTGYILHRKVFLPQSVKYYIFTRILNDKKLNFATRSITQYAFIKCGEGTQASLFIHV